MESLALLQFPEEGNKQHGELFYQARQRFTERLLEHISEHGEGSYQAWMEATDVMQFLGKVITHMSEVIDEGYLPSLIEPLSHHLRSLDVVPGRSDGLPNNPDAIRYRIGIDNGNKLSPGQLEEAAADFGADWVERTILRMADVRPHRQDVALGADLRQYISYTPEQHIFGVSQVGAPNNKGVMYWYNPRNRKMSWYAGDNAFEEGLKRSHGR